MKNLTSRLQKSQKAKGFTLIELIIAIAIIGILFAFIAPNFGGSISKAKDTTKLQSAKVVHTALETAQILGEDLGSVQINSLLADNGINFGENDDICMYWGYGGDTNSGLANVYVAVMLSDDWAIYPEGTDVSASGNVSSECTAPSINGSGDPQRVTTN